MKGGKMKKRLFFCFFCLWVIFFLSCKKEENATEIKSYPLDTLEGIITQENLQLDKENSFDGKGSIKISAKEPTVVKLFETGKMEIQNSKLIFQAKLKSENLEGQAFLEIWCVFTGKGELFGRGLQGAISGNLNWHTSEAYFFLEKGQIPDNIKLNLVINGKGTVWIDDIKLIKAPL